MRQMNQHKWVCAIWQARKKIRKTPWWNFRNPIPGIIDRVRQKPHITPFDMAIWMDGWMDAHFMECNPTDAKIITSYVIDEAYAIWKS